MEIAKTAGRIAVIALKGYKLGIIGIDTFKRPGWIGGDGMSVSQ
jgi:hypothetical protein